MELRIEKEWNGFVFSTFKEKLDLPFIHDFISTKSYWAKGIPLEVMQRSVKNSLCIGIYDKGNQVGFARVVTDFATFGYLADVFVSEPYRGRGLSKRLVQFILEVDEFKLFRRFLLATRDAHALYAQYGFKPLSKPESFMERHKPDPYGKPSDDNIQR